MSRRAYEEDGSEDDWNTVSDPAFDPNNSEYLPLESPVRRGRRGRGPGGRRGRGEGGGHGQHPQGEIVAHTPRARGAVSNHTMIVPRIQHVNARPNKAAYETHRIVSETHGVAQD